MLPNAWDVKSEPEQQAGSVLVVKGMRRGTLCSKQVLDGACVREMLQL